MRSMAAKRYSIFLLILLSASLRSRAQANNSAAVDTSTKSADEVKALLAASFDRNTFAYLPGPYHFLAKFQTFGPDGQSTGNGSIEKYFARPGYLKVITRFKDHTMNTYYAGDARAVYTDDGFDGSIMTYFANSFLLLPLPPPAGIDRRDMETSVKQIQGETLDCGMYQFFVESPGQPTLPKEVLCVERESNNLTLTQTLHFSIRYKNFAPFLNKMIPRSIVVSKGPTVRCRIQLEQVDQASLSEADLAPPADASPVSPGPDWLATNIGEGILKRMIKPVYPDEAKKAHVGGQVYLLVLLSRTGTVLDVEPVYSPTPDLEKAAEDAVRQWLYTPIIREGRPVETIINTKVNFSPN